MKSKIKLAIFVIVLVMCSIFAYNISKNGLGLSEFIAGLTNGMGLSTDDKKKETKEVSEACTSNAECKNNACGRLDAGSGKLICCPSGDISTFGAYDYCTQIADHSPCFSDVMCASGYCKDNGGGTEKGVCRPKSRVGEKCEIDDDCTNSACARASAAKNTPLTCCASGRTQLYNGYHYCKEMADSNTCWSDAMCASGYCAENGGGTQRGTCKTKESAGARCSSDEDCMSDACARATAAENAPLTCCAKDSSIYWGFYYCDDMPKGSTCWSDAMCKSENCSGNALGTKRGTCD